MKKHLFKILLSLVCIFSFISVTACSCFNKISVYYVVDIYNEDGLGFKNKLAVYVKVEKRFRTAEEATATKLEKQEIAKDSIVGVAYSKEEIKISKESKKFDLPDEPQGLIFTVNLRNYDADNTLTNSQREKKKFYVKAPTKEEILGGLVKQESLEKVTLITPEPELVQGEEKYYLLEVGEILEFSVEIKGLTKKDMELSKTSNLKLYFDLKVRGPFDN